MCRYLEISIGILGVWAKAYIFDHYVLGARFINQSFDHGGAAAAAAAFAMKNGAHGSNNSLAISSIHEIGSSVSVIMIPHNKNSIFPSRHEITKNYFSCVTAEPLIGGTDYLNSKMAFAIRSVINGITLTTDLTKQLIRSQKKCRVNLRYLK